MCGCTHKKYNVKPSFKNGGFISELPIKEKSKYFSYLDNNRDNSAFWDADSDDDAFRLMNKEFGLEYNQTLDVLASWMKSRGLNKNGGGVKIDHKEGFVVRAKSGKFVFVNGDDENIDSYRLVMSHLTATVFSKQGDADKALDFINKKDIFQQDLSVEVYQPAMYAEKQLGDKMSNGGKVGEDITQELKDFDLDNLDRFEEFHYNHFSKSMPKEEALQIIINSIEGDYTQLSPELAILAEKETPSSEWDRWSMEQNGYKNGGAVNQKRLKIYKNKIEKQLSEKKIYLKILKGGLKKARTEEEYDKIADGIDKTKKQILISNKMLEGTVGYENGGGVDSNTELSNSIKSLEKKGYVVNSRIFGGWKVERGDEMMKLSDSDLIEFSKHRFAKGGGVNNPTASKRIRASDEAKVSMNLVNGEVAQGVLEQIVGRKLDRWNDDVVNIGLIKLTKCFLRPYYRI